MKKFNLAILSICLILFSSCGWSENQKQAARETIGDGFSSGLEISGSTVDEKVKDDWVNCVIDKASDKYTFDEFSKGGPALEAIQEECANEVGLYDAITMSGKE